MIITLTFKTPDIVQDAAVSAVALQEPTTEQELKHFHDADDNLEYWREDEAEEIKKRLAQWIQYGEVITLEFDLTANTATVCKVQK